MSGRARWWGGWCLGLLLLVGCRSTTQSVLEPLKADQIQEQMWEDDLELRDLDRAIQQSLKYYRRLPSTQTFDYAGTSYTAKEMAQSLELFRKIMTSYRGKARQDQLRRHFLFFESKNEKGGAFYTGYYEPLLLGSPQPKGALSAPLYAKPKDLIQADLGAFREEWKEHQIIGKVQGDRFVPYDDRAAIVDKNSLKGRATPLVYVNEIELFFLQIQGSGVVQMPDGKKRRLNYASKNGRPYRPIGKLLIERGQMSREEVSLQTLKAHLHKHPEQVQEILNYNPSYTFFREVEEGPLGNIEVPLTPERSIATDRRLLPRGGLVFIETTYPQVPNESLSGQPLHRFALVQDTGGAIVGQGRADLFWGHGPRAEQMAGRLKHPGRLFLLVARKESLAAPALVGQVSP